MATAINAPEQGPAHGPGEISELGLGPKSAQGPGEASVERQSFLQSFPQSFPWLAVAWFLALIIAAYLPILKNLVLQWSTDEDVSHGL